MMNAAKAGRCDRSLDQVRITYLLISIPSVSIDRFTNAVEAYDWLPAFLAWITLACVLGYSNACEGSNQSWSSVSSFTRCERRRCGCMVFCHMVEAGTAVEGIFLWKFCSLWLQNARCTCLIILLMHVPHFLLGKLNPVSVYVMRQSDDCSVVRPELLL